MSHTDEHAHKGQFSLTIGERGRLVLPAELRRRLSLKTGDRLVARIEDDGSIRVISTRAAAESGRGLLPRMYPHLKDASLVDELLAERRREAERESRGE